MPRALITGISGFTGKYLAAELTAAGYEVFGTSFNTSHVKHNVFSVNLCEIDAVRKIAADTSPDVVVHLAAVSFVAHGNVDEIYRTNIVGTRNLLQALSELETQPRSVLLASSSNVYGNATDSPITEETQLAPANDYAVSKLAMEHVAALWLDKLPITVVRPFNYIGVGQSPQFLLPKVISHFRAGKKEIELGNIDLFRDFSDVRVVAESYRKLIELAPAGKFINVCSGLSVSLREMINIISEIAGYDIQIKVNPAFVRNNEIKRLAASNEFLTELIGEIRSIPIRDTLEWMYKKDED